MLPLTVQQAAAHDAALRSILDPLEIKVSNGFAKIETSRGTELVDLTATRPDAAVKQLIRVANSRGFLEGQKVQRDRTLQALGASPITLAD
jgi:hypothetical protein|tara:strand:- start:139 stop:411 length:273 start_codon:yes stop_codon:yes gene_type:complete